MKYLDHAVAVASHFAHGIECNPFGADVDEIGTSARAVNGARHAMAGREGIRTVN